MIEREVKAEVWIPLTQGKVTVIDFDDFEKVRGFKYHAFKRRNGFYAARKQKRQTTIFLHQDLLGAKPDHIDGDGLNNRRVNLRTATTAQNSWGYRKKKEGASSQYRGVFWSARDSVWQSQIGVSGNRIHLGTFEDEELAGRAYDAAAKTHFGEFAQLNFPGQ